jgi:2-haloacid dehalogenase
MGVVAFDALGTLFELTPLQDRLGRKAVEAWFQRLLHSAAVLTLLGKFERFDRLASSTLETTVAKLELEVDPGDVLDALDELPAHPGAREALERIADRGHEIRVLTNGGRESTQQLLDRSRLADLVAQVHAAEDAGAYKPDFRTYALLPGASTMVAAHAWDVGGARSAGLEAIWIDGSERIWPFPDNGPPKQAPDLVAAAGLVS